MRYRVRKIARFGLTSFNSKLQKALIYGRLRELIKRREMLKDWFKSCYPHIAKALKLRGFGAFCFGKIKGLCVVCALRVKKIAGLNLSFSSLLCFMRSFSFRSACCSVCPQQLRAPALHGLGKQRRIYQVLYLPASVLIRFARS